MLCVTGGRAGRHEGAGGVAAAGRDGAVLCSGAGASAGCGQTHPAESSSQAGANTAASHQTQAGLTAGPHKLTTTHCSIISVEI